MSPITQHAETLHREPLLQTARGPCRTLEKFLKNTRSLTQEKALFKENTVKADKTYMHKLGNHKRFPHTKNNMEKGIRGV